MLFCDQDETIQHLFITCPFAHILWKIVHITFYIPSSTNITNLFGTWLRSVPNKDKPHIWVGVCALLWAIWYVRNNFIINKSRFPSFLHVISLTTRWIHMWSISSLSEHGYWVHPFENGCTGFLQSARFAFWGKDSMLMQRRLMSLCLFNGWFMHGHPWAIEAPFQIKKDTNIKRVNTEK